MGEEQINKFGVVFTVSPNDLSQATVVAGPIDVRGIDSATIQAVLAGAPAGSMVLQGCIGNPVYNGSQPTWPQTFTAMGTVVPVSGPMSYLWDYDSACSAIQVVFTKSGTSSGTMACGANLVNQT